MAKKKTHEEYVAELAEKRPDVEVTGLYINAKTNVEHRCKIHDVYWVARPDNVLHGKCCPECAREGRRNANCMTHEEYVSRLSVENPDIEIVGEYVDAKTKSLHHCLKHDVYWDVMPNSVLYKHSGCPECAKEKFRSSMMKSQEEYINELSIKNPDVELVDECKGGKIATQHYCKIHNVLFNIRPEDALQGSGCNECKSYKLRMKKLKTEEEYIVELAEKNPFVKLVGNYHESLTPTEHLCLIHNVVWSPTPARVLSGGGCKQCGSEKISNYFMKPRQDYIEELSDKNRDVELIGEYLGGKKPTQHYCKIHNVEFVASPESVLKGRGCSHCVESKGERLVRQWLEKCDIKYKYQEPFDDCRDVLPFPFDFYLPEFNVCIEYDGKQHFEPIEYFGGQEAFEYTQKHDKIKNEYCKNNNIKLLRIPYFANVEEELNNFLFI